MNKKIFKGINIVDNTLTKNMTDYLNNVNLVFTIKWIVDRKITLYKLHLKKNDEDFRNVITDTITDYDGEISIDLGNFSNEDKIEVDFGILAITDVEKIGIFIVENNSIVTKVKPEGQNDYMKLDHSNLWKDSLLYKLKS
jgi:hypothetical protein